MRGGLFFSLASSPASICPFGTCTLHSCRRCLCREIGERRWSRDAWSGMLWSALLAHLAILWLCVAPGVSDALEKQRLAPPRTGGTAWNKKSLHPDMYKQLASAFMSYHIFFRTIERQSSLTCATGDYANETQLLLDDAVNMCMNPYRRTRQLRRTQVSWRPTNQETGPSKAKKDPASSNGSASAAEPAAAEEEEARPSKIHNYLVFGLVLKEHPFSDKVRQVLSVVGPMFPSITVVYGDGYEFQDLVDKFYMRSFPKILLFKSGLYVGDYEGAYTAPELASELALWTRQLPRSFPAIPAALPRIPPTISVQLPFASSFSSSFLSKLPFQSLLLPRPNLEPFLGSVQEHAKWDIAAFLFSGGYCMLRILQAAWPKR